MHLFAHPPLFRSVITCMKFKFLLPDCSFALDLLNVTARVSLAVQSYMFQTGQNKLESNSPGMPPETTVKYEIVRTFLLAKAPT
jgi:hypothetical protein